MFHIGHVRLFHRGVGVEGGGCWDVWGLSLHNPSVICFPGCDFLFQRALIRSADTWEPSAVSSRGGDTLTGRGIRADWPPTPPKCHFIASWQKESETAHTHACIANTYAYQHIFSLRNNTLAIFNTTALSCETSQTFVGTSHPFEIISKSRLSSNQVRENPHLCKGHKDFDSYKDGRIEKKKAQSDVSPQHLIFLSWCCLHWEQELSAWFYILVRKHGSFNLSFHALVFLAYPCQEVISFFSSLQFAVKFN